MERETLFKAEPGLGRLESQKRDDLREPLGREYLKKAQFKCQFNGTSEKSWRFTGSRG